MPGVPTHLEVVDDAPAEVSMEQFVAELRAAVGRLEEDAEIALELNPESQALDDVHLMRDVICVYAERIMALEAAVRGAQAICHDDAAWADGAAPREKLLDVLGPTLEVA